MFWFLVSISVGARAPRAGPGPLLTQAGSRYRRGCEVTTFAVAPACAHFCQPLDVENLYSIGWPVGGDGPSTGFSMRVLYSAGGATTFLFFVSSVRGP